MFRHSAAFLYFYMRMRDIRKLHWERKPIIWLGLNMQYTFYSPDRKESSRIVFMLILLALVANHTPSFYKKSHFALV